MLARTHGQPAVPTTLGKEILVFGIRLMTQIERLEKLQFQAKFNGAVGGYQAQVFALPSVDWLALNKELVTSLGFEFSELTTQVSFNEDLVELFTILHQVNSIFIDFNQDIWRYISDDWLVQSTKKDQVGSSTMPQKVNPIDFENSEGNLELANALFELFARKLPVSRLQRDLSNSTIMRNIGSAFGYSLLAYTSLHRGLGKISANEVVISQSLNKNYNILAEAWQTLARANGDNQAYEKLAMLSKNTALSKEKWQQLTANIDSRLSNLTPETYLGLSVFLTKKYLKKINQYLKISRHEKGSSE
jgi:adenylosuccinate lyase